jgi:hypothetical protein
MDAINSVCNSKETPANNFDENSHSSSNSLKTEQNKTDINNTSVTLDDVNKNFSKKTRHQSEHEDDFDRNNSCSGDESSISMVNPSSVKNMTEFDEEDLAKKPDIEEIDDEMLNDLAKPQPKKNPSSSSLKNKSNSKENKLTLSDICSNGNTFLWDLLINQSINSNLNQSQTATQIEASFNTSDVAKNESCTNLSVSQSSISNNSSISSQNSPNKKQNVSSTQNSSLTQKQRILREAEKQLQVLLCLPSTDKRVRLQFIESCIRNLSENKVVHVSLRLLMKLFSSFQQFASPSQNSNSNVSLQVLDSEKSPNSTISRIQQSILSLSQTNTSRHLQSHFNTPGNVLEVHKIVAWCETRFGLIHAFFTSLAEYVRVELSRLNEVSSDLRAKADLIGQIRLNVQTRLQFLSFLFSSLGSPNDFELSSKHVECLWDSLIKFDDFVVEQPMQHANVNSVGGSIASLSTSNLTEQVFISCFDDYFRTKAVGLNGKFTKN